MKPQELMKEDAAQRMVRAVNRLCHNSAKNSFYLVREDSSIPDYIYEAATNKNPESILVIDDLTLTMAKRFPKAHFTLALTPARVPVASFALVKQRIEKYYREVAHRDVEIISLNELF